MKHTRKQTLQVAAELVNLAELQGLLRCCCIHLLHPQVALCSAAADLSASLPASTSSGVLRFEVPLSRGGPPGGVLLGSPCQPGFSALQWLQGQEGLRDTLHSVYFSGRHSTAPDTPGTAAAEAAADGWMSLAGLGAAWLWQGAAGRGFDTGVMAGLTRFLSENQPRLRVVGGSRWVVCSACWLASCLNISDALCCAAAYMPTRCRATMQSNQICKKQSCRE